MGLIQLGGWRDMSSIIDSVIEVLSISIRDERSFSVVVTFRALLSSESESGVDISRRLVFDPSFLHGSSWFFPYPRWALLERPPPEANEALVSKYICCHRRSYSMRKLSYWSLSRQIHLLQKSLNFTRRLRWLCPNSFCEIIFVSTSSEAFSM